MSDKSRPEWLDDPDAPPSKEEEAASARLRDALADATITNADADLARALSLAEQPRDLDSAEHRVMVERAVGAMRPKRNVVRVVFGAGTALALAAALVLVVGKSLVLSRAGAPAESPLSMAHPGVPSPLAAARSTQDLFTEPFEKPLARGAISARIDRIAMARSTDLRENRFAMWGVK
jgi:hypothetical protein